MKTKKKQHTKNNGRWKRHTHTQTHRENKLFCSWFVVIEKKIISTITIFVHMTQWTRVMIFNEIWWIFFVPLKNVVWPKSLNHLTDEAKTRNVWWMITLQCVLLHIQKWRKKKCTPYSVQSIIIIFVIIIQCNPSFGPTMCAWYLLNESNKNNKKPFGNLSKKCLAGLWFAYLLSEYYRLVFV